MVLCVFAVLATEGTRASKGEPARGGTEYCWASRAKWLHREGDFLSRNIFCLYKTIYCFCVAVCVPVVFYDCDNYLKRLVKMSMCSWLTAVRSRWSWLYQRAPAQSNCLPAPVWHADEGRATAVHWSTKACRHRYEFAQHCQRDACWSSQVHTPPRLFGWCFLIMVLQKSRG